MPIVQPLRELNAGNKRKAEEEELKREPKEEKKESRDDDDDDTDVYDDDDESDVRDATAASSTSAAERGKIEEADEENDDTADDDDVEEASLFDEYANKSKKEIDTTYGPKTVLNEKVLGFKKIAYDVTAGEIVLSRRGDGGDRSKFKGTRGLFELLFMDKPKGYTAEDLGNYKRMLTASGAHLKSDGRINANKGYKYKNVISRLFPPTAAAASAISASKTKSGTAIDEHNDNNVVDASMLVTDKKIDYVHWNDPNALVERYALLNASARAGNTSHANEQVSILNELIRAGYL